MEDSIIIWKYLTRAIPDDSVRIYLYCMGGARSSKETIDNIVSETKIIFSPPMEISYLETVVKAFLDMKRKQYKNAEIKIKPIY
jgi:hypothetical protein